MHRSGWIVRLSLALVLAPPAPLRAQGDRVPDAQAGPDTLGPARWGFSITPYIWSAGQNGTLGVDGGEANLDLSVGDVLDNIKVGLAALGEARRERWLGRLDFVYHSIGGVPKVGDRVELDGATLTVESTDGRRVGKVLAVRIHREPEPDLADDGD